MRISTSIAFGLLCVGLLQSSYSQLTNASGGASMSGDFYISSPGEGIDLANHGTSAAVSGTWDFGADNVAARAWILNTGGNIIVGETSFNVTAQANAHAQVFGSQTHERVGGAGGWGYAEQYMEFAHPTLFSIDGNASGSGSATEHGSGYGNGQARIQIDNGQLKTVTGGGASGSPPLPGSVHLVGLGSSVSVSLSAYAQASGHSYPDLQPVDSLGAGAGGSSASGTFDFDVIDPLRFGKEYVVTNGMGEVLTNRIPPVFTNFLGSALGNCRVIARYPPFCFYTYTHKVGSLDKDKIDGLDNVKSVVMDPLPGAVVPFGFTNRGYCSVIYKIGVTQNFDFSISYRLVANGPLIRFAPLGQTTARIDYPASWTNTCLFLTNIVLTPPSGSYLPVGTNQGNVTWSSSTGLSGDCPFEIIVKTNEYGLFWREEFPNDSDEDGMADWQELIAGTETLDASSVLKLEAPVLTATNLTLTWPTVPGIRYQVEAGGVADGGFVPVGDVITGTEGLVTTNVVVPLQSSTNRFYRIRVAVD